MRFRRLSSCFRKEPGRMSLVAILSLGLMVLVVLTCGPQAWATARQDVRHQTIPETVPITLTVTLQRPNAPAPDPSWAVPVHFALYPPGDPNTILYQWNLTLDQWGSWSGDLIIENGQYDARLKNMHTLRNVRRNVNIAGPTTIYMGELHEGDANGDNRIRITDFGILRNAYFTDQGDPDFDPRADFDEDDRIRISDFALLRMNYFQDGDIEVTLAGKARERRLSRPQLPAPSRSVTGVLQRAAFCGVLRLEAVDLSVEPPAVATMVGDVFTVTVMVNAGAQEVVGADIDLHFEPSLLQVVDAAGQPADQVEPAGPLEVIFNQVDPSAGRIRYAAGTFDVASGDFPLAIVRFKALASTQSTSLHFDYADVAAPGGQSVVGDLRDGTVSIARAPKRYLPLLLRSR